MDQSLAAPCTFHSASRLLLAQGFGEAAVRVLEAAALELERNGEALLSVPDVWDSITDSDPVAQFVELSAAHEWGSAA